MNLSIQECLYEISMDWRTPFIATILYLVYVRHQNNRLRGAVATERSLLSFVSLLMIVHNIVLAAFSMYVFKQNAPFIFNRFRSVSFKMFCADENKYIFNHVHYWSWVFYLSKIYEIMDTVILHLNKKRATFLQCYHHAGAIFATYLFCKAESHMAWIFVVLNSFVHSVMYLYYLISVFRIRIRFKKIITTMQMTQFILGYILIAMHFIGGQRFSSDLEKRVLEIITIIFNVGYVMFLFILFKMFFKKEYQKKKSKTITKVTTNSESRESLPGIVAS